MSTIYGMYRVLTGMLFFYTLVIGSLLTSAKADLIGHGGMIRAVNFSSDGKKVVTASFDYSAIIWDFQEQKKIAVLEGHNGPVTNAHFLPNGRIFTTGDDMLGIIWNLNGSEADIEYYLRGHSHKIMAATVFDNGRQLVTGSWDKTVRIWSALSGKMIRKIKLPVPVNAVAVIADERWIAVGGHDNKIRIFNIRNGKALGSLRGHNMGITELRASSRGNFLLSSSIDRTLRLWDVVRQVSIRHLQRHDSQVLGVRFTPDEKYAVSGGRDGYVMVWDLSTGNLKKAIKAHKEIVWTVAISPDGRFVISGSSDETARVWHLQSGDRIGGDFDDIDEPKPWLESSHPGAKMFQKCARCHSLGPEYLRRSGPHLKGLFGRRVGTVEGYRYSDALKSRNFIWDKDTLFKLFDEGPDKFLPGTKMPVQRVSDRERLTELVEYLETLTSVPN